MTLRFEGFHGTSFESAASVIRQGYKPSVNDRDWLGDGVYFFTEGLSKTPIHQAEEWAKAQSWDKEHHAYKYAKLSVLKSHIAVDEERLLDLTTADGVEIIDYIIAKHIEKMSSIGKRMTYIDGYVINFARLEGILPIDVAKGNFYIKFERERIKRIDRRTANCTICAVYEPTKNIEKTELLLTKEF